MRFATGSAAALLALTVANCSAVASVQSDTHEFKLPNTIVLDLPTSANGFDYQIYVHVPPGCKNNGNSCPAVYMLDAEYSFALAAQIVTHLTERDRIRPVISVAIGYPDKSQYRQFRTRDYTPFFHPTGGYGRELQKRSGGGPEFLNVIRSEVIPYIEKHFPVTADERTIVGHSYGGLFALYAWINSPDVFANYIIVSPSLWYADNSPLAAAQAACDEKQIAGDNHLFLAVGAYEEQPDAGHEMVSDLQKLGKILRSCVQREISSTLRVYDDETHASIFPAALSTGLRILFQH